MNCASLRLAIFSAVFLFSAGAVHAQTAAAPAPMVNPVGTAPALVPVTKPATVTQPAMPVRASTPAPTAATVVTPAMPVADVDDDTMSDEQIMAQMGAPVPPLGMPVMDAAMASKNNAIPSSVNEVVNDLKTSEKNVSLDDMARAQDAIARLDLLLEIEKRINDIEKARDDRKNIGRGSRSSMAGLGGLGGIPASALGLPSLPSAAPGTASVRVTDAPSSNGGSMRATPAVASGSDYTVEQITAVNGNYRAVVQGSGSDRQTVSQGDKVGRYTVQKISASGVVLAQGSDRKTLTVESDGAPVLIRAR